MAIYLDPLSVEPMTPSALALHPRLLDLQEQITRLPDQLAELPAFAIASRVKNPCLSAFLLPRGAPE